MEDIIKDALIKMVSKQIVKFIASKLPFLGSGPLGWILSFFVSKVLSIAFYHTVMGAKIIAIDFEVNAQTKHLKKKLDRYKNAKNEKEREDAKNKVIDASRDLFDFN